MKALIVEDNDEARKLLGELLKQSGFEVFEAENGKKALEILKEKKDFDIIISDVLMPVMDGFKFCYEVKSNPESNFIPFVFYTGSYISAEDKMFGLKLGADDYITKPIKFEALLDRINKAIERKGIRKPVAEFEEATYLKEYNERLIHKLEEKLIELNQAYEQIKEKNKELETINLILTAINSTKNIKHLLKQISKPFSEIFDADAVNFFIFDRTKNCLKTRSFRLAMTSPRR
jgi:DNA-binding response OmpR family regulator